MLKVKRGVKSKLLQAAGFAKGWLGRMIVLCKDSCSNDIMEELNQALNHLKNAIELIESSEVVR